jgi:hypothetical protein
MAADGQFLLAVDTSSASHKSPGSFIWLLLTWVC